ncbi:hypothetical protein LPJ64_004378 [Coemansia asiatica]|uniref:3-oxo-5-alpha-steroid 4-dehydrogenase C-terminal domain-containing protein n=1 Tax=Coemansia asiatica TaxID=1052880 RepID=A0A9W8CHX0_9FUNG|nr:hypothetical protein LPJ64_004378 [Coemansia asiatica]
MELVSPLVFVLSYVYPSQIGNSQSPATFLFLLMWVAHYANRSIVYPLRQPSRKPMHIGVMLSACFFNVVNGYVNGRWLATLYPEQSRSPVLIISGIFMFALGMFGNIYHDEILIKLKKQSKGYSVPFGGQYGLHAT